MKADFLKGYSVLLNAHYIPGPLAAWFLGNLGARIIKLEPPGGDLFRHVPPFFHGEKGKISAYFRALNGGFESISVNLKEPAGKEIFSALLKRSDVYIDGNRPGFVEKLTGKSVDEINPDVVFVPITGYGLSGPDYLKACHDGNCMAESGTLSHHGDAERGFSPPLGIQAVDLTAGMVAACTCMAMLLGKKNPDCHTRANVCDSSMLDAALLLNQIYISKFSADQKEMKPGKEWLNGGRGYYSTYQTSDKRAIFFAAIEPKLFQNFAEKIGRMDLLEIRQKSEQDPQLLIAELEKIFAARTLAQWQNELEHCDCCFSTVRKVGEAFDAPQIKHRDLIKEVNDPSWGKMQQLCYPGLFAGEIVEPAQTAPDIGQQTKQILEELGFEAEKIKQLIESKVVRTG